MEFIYLDEIINQYLSQYRLPESAYDRIAQLAIRGRKELHLHSCGHPLTETKEVQSDKTITLSAGWLNLLSVGYRNSDGKLIYLEENDDLTLQNTYRLERETGIVYLPSEFSESELEVVTLPQATQDGDYLVHPLFVEALIKWIVWEDGLGNPKISGSTSAENERRYYNALRHARRAVKPFSLDQVYKQYARTSTNNLSVFKWN